MTDEEKKDETIKVVDKRRFDESGDSKESCCSGGKCEEKPASAEADFVMKEGDSAHPQVDFSAFIMSLGTQALMQMGEMKAPEGFDVPVDKDAATQTIDILELLKTKTKGNLDENEDKLLDDLLHNLRMCFIQKNKV